MDHDVETTDKLNTTGIYQLCGYVVRGEQSLFHSYQVLKHGCYGICGYVFGLQYKHRHLQRLSMQVQGRCGRQHGGLCYQETCKSNLRQFKFAQTEQKRLT
jgi:hypothetical protein